MSTTSTNPAPVSPWAPPVSERSHKAVLCHGPYITWGIKRRRMRSNRELWTWWAALDVPGRIKSQMDGGREFETAGAAWAAADAGVAAWVGVYEREKAAGVAK